MGFNVKYTKGSAYNKKRVLLKAQILHAQQETLSGAQAARYLGVSYQTYKRYAMLYNIFEQHKSDGTGIKHTRYKVDKETGLLDILEGHYPNYDPRKLKRRLISSGILKNCCALCGFGEQHVADGSVPLLLYFIDGDRHNLRKENIQLRCYNCTYLTSGKVNERKYNQYTKEEPPRKEIIEPETLTEEETKKLQSELFEIDKRE